MRIMIISVIRPEVSIPHQSESRGANKGCGGLEGANTQDFKHTDISTYRLNQSRGQCSEHLKVLPGHDSIKELHCDLVLFRLWKSRWLARTHFIDIDVIYIVEENTHHLGTLLIILLLDFVLKCISRGYQVVVQDLVLVQCKDCTNGTLLPWSTTKREKRQWDESENWQAKHMRKQIVDFTCFHSFVVKIGAFCTTNVKKNDQTCNMCVNLLVPWRTEKQLRKPSENEKVMGAWANCQLS